MTAAAVALQSLSLITYIAYTVTAIALKHDPTLKTTWINTVWKLTKWPALAGLIYLWVMRMTEGNLEPIDMFSVALGAVGWYISSNSGDDDTKKKMKDLASAVVRVFEGRLVVVPRSA